MAELLKYLSPEWRDEVHKQLVAELTPEKMNHVTTSMSNICVNCPDGQQRYFFVRCVDGNIAEVAVGEGEGPAAEFRITGDYETFAQISRAELAFQRALMGGQLKLRGNMVKALKLASIADRLNKVIATIPTDYK